MNRTVGGVGGRRGDIPAPPTRLYPPGRSVRPTRERFFSPLLLDISPADRRARRSHPTVLVRANGHRSLVRVDRAVRQLRHLSRIESVRPFPLLNPRRRLAKNKKARCDLDRTSHRRRVVCERPICQASARSSSTSACCCAIRSASIGLGRPFHQHQKTCTKPERA